MSTRTGSERFGVCGGAGGWVTGGGGAALVVGDGGAGALALLGGDGGCGDCGALLGTLGSPLDAGGGCCDSEDGGG
ncbi:hypothetical protein [Kibdelosporangium phytohabitans]|uniref:hypothetical protein n=1 Tax=Kibdelosporangium phytohabitans TaxID=860235 RepID=UPI0019FBCF58|nr:hypothetical protein [Kibdelosporangium phytohabitans]